MKKTSTQQANRRFHLKHHVASNGMNTSLRLMLLMLLCGCLSVGTTAWSQTRSAETAATRSSSRTPSASETKTEKKASEARAERKTSDTRTETKAAESRTETKATQTRSSEARTKSETTSKQSSTRNQVQEESREAVRQPAVRQETGDVRQGRGSDVRNGSTRGADMREGASQRRPDAPNEDRRVGRTDGSRETPSTRMSSGYRLVPGSRNPERIKIILPDRRFRNDHERCSFCFGVGFVYTHDRLHRLRCSQCYGRGFALDFVTRLDDVCPICYSPVSGYGPIHRRTIQNTASYVMDRMDYLLNLSRSQERAIKRIVLDYLRDSRYDGWYNPVVARDRAIMRELSNRQRDIYVDFMNNLDSRDLCDRCFDYF